MSAPEIVFKNTLNVYSHILGRGASLSGNHRLPPGPKIIAANHTVGSDPLFIPPALEETVYFLFQDGLFRVPVVGWMLKHAGHIPVQRDSEKSKEALEKACQMLHQGKTIVLFPEGRLVPRGERIRAKTGVIRMALATGAPIIPLGIHVAEKDTISIKDGENFMLWQISGKCHMRFGAAWRPDSHQINFHKSTDELMDRIYSLVAETERELSCVSPTLLNPIPR
jgi:1-acyl-sn-glycerol-3-phosphate acyltransferase